MPATVGPQLGSHCAVVVINATWQGAWRSPARCFTAVGAVLAEARTGSFPSEPSGLEAGTAARACTLWISCGRLLGCGG